MEIMTMARQRRYTAIEYCDELECRCLDRAGVILYDGPDEEELAEATGQARPGYRIVIEER